MTRNVSAEGGVSGGGAVVKQDRGSSSGSVSVFLFVICGVVCDLVCCRCLVMLVVK